MSRAIKVSPPHRSGSKDWDPIEMERYWRPVFDKYDVDKDGTIPLKDLKDALKSGGDLRHDFPDDVIDEIVEWSDLNHDGLLNYNEFLKMVYAHELGETHPVFQKIVYFAALVVVPKSRQKITVRHCIEECTWFRPPIFLLIIILIELGIYIYYCVLYKEFSATGPVPCNSVLIYNPGRRYEAWRYITYMFVHNGFEHIFFNLFTQLLLGLPLELIHKSWRVMLVYLGGVLAGSLGSSLSHPARFLAGASGGVYALIAAHLANVIINFSEMTFGWLRLFGLLVFGGIDIGFTFYFRCATDGKTCTSYAAHFAGALAGLMIGIVCLRNLKVHKWETILGWVLFSIFVILMIFVILWNILNTGYYPEEDP